MRLRMRETSLCCGKSKPSNGLTAPGQRPMVSPMVIPRPTVQRMETSTRGRKSMRPRRQTNEHDTGQTRHRRRGDFGQPRDAGGGPTRCQGRIARKARGSTAANRPTGRVNGGEPAPVEPCRPGESSVLRRTVQGIDETAGGSGDASPANKRDSTIAGGKSPARGPVEQRAKPANPDVTGRAPAGAHGGETGSHENHLPSVTAGVAKVRKRSHQSNPHRLASTKKLFLYLRGRIHARTASLSACLR